MHKSVATLVAVVTGLLLSTSACSSESGAVEKLKADQAVELIESGGPAVIDVRTPAEYAAGHVEGAENIDVSAASFEQQVSGLPKDEDYVVYCQSGNRSADAAAKMVELGFTDVADGGGIVSLEAAGATIVSGG